MKFLASTKKTQPKDRPATYEQEKGLRRLKQLLMDCRELLGGSRRF